MTLPRRLGAIALCLSYLGNAPVFAQTVAAQPGPPSVAGHAAETIKRLPADMVTKHTIELPGRTLRFTATAGSVTLSNSAGEGQAQIAYIAFTLDGANPHQRPLSFAMNGGPGSGSAWLNLGLLGPWRMPMDPEAAHPSASPLPMDNADTWLDLTDLVFIDPIGTGYSKLLVNSEDNRKKYWSVTGDVASIAEGIRLYLESAKRMSSPKYIIGESYAGIRGPRLLRELATKQSIGITGLTLISPKLDYGNRSLALDTMEWVAQLPSLVAASRAKSGPVTWAMMADVESYAVGDYASDLIRGQDPAAVKRRVDHVTAYTGLDRALVERRQGKITTSEYLHERNHDTAQVGSPYDATILKADPYPQNVDSNYPDPMTDALQAPFVSAMVDIYSQRLNWLPDARYEISSETVFHAWDFGHGFYKPESVTYLRQALATDPKLHVLIGHGLFDLLTPYFDTKMMLDQIPKSVGADRIDFEVYPGGHMFYSRDDSRVAFRDAAKKLYEAK